MKKITNSDLLSEICKLNNLKKTERAPSKVGAFFGVYKEYWEDTLMLGESLSQNMKKEKNC